MILSYHPYFHGHRFRLCAGRDPDSKDRKLMREASAVLLPPGRLPALYEEAMKHCGLVFPNYSSRYSYPGKIGDIQLFREKNLPHPGTHAFNSLKECPSDYWQTIDYPVIIKHSAGGEGRLVYLAHTPDEAMDVLSDFKGMEKEGFYGFLVQEFVDAGHSTLRVVVMHTCLYSYWRVQPDPGKIKHNLAQGGIVDHESDQRVQARGRELVRQLRACSGINLAGIDVLFDHSISNEPRPLLLEVNYFFAFEGLGGLDGYHELLKKAVKDWLLDKGLPLPPKDFGPD